MARGPPEGCVACNCNARQNVKQRQTNVSERGSWTLENRASESRCGGGHALLVTDAVSLKVERRVICALSLLCARTRCRTCKPASKSNSHAHFGSGQGRQSASKLGSACPESHQVCIVDGPSPRGHTTAVRQLASSKPCGLDIGCWHGPRRATRRPARSRKAIRLILQAPRLIARLTDAVNVTINL